jgi:hypothetical protein
MTDIWKTIPPKYRAGEPCAEPYCRCRGTHQHFAITADGSIAAETRRLYCRGCATKHQFVQDGASSGGTTYRLEWEVACTASR